MELEFLAILSILVRQSLGNNDKGLVTTDFNFATDHLAALSPDSFDRVVSWDKD